jgi:hypothetical protein
MPISPKLDVAGSIPVSRSSIQELTPATIPQFPSVSKLDLRFDVGGERPMPIQITISREPVPLKAQQIQDRE